MFLGERLQQMHEKWLGRLTQRLRTPSAEYTVGRVLLLTFAAVYGTVLYPTLADVPPPPHLFPLLVVWAVYILVLAFLPDEVLTSRWCEGASIVGDVVLIALASRWTGGSESKLLLALFFSAHTAARRLSGVGAIVVCALVGVGCFAGSVGAFWVRTLDALAFADAIVLSLLIFVFGLLLTHVYDQLTLRRIEIAQWIQEGARVWGFADRIMTWTSRLLGASSVKEVGQIATESARDLAGARAAWLADWWEDGATLTVLSHTNDTPVLDREYCLQPGMAAHVAAAAKNPHGLVAQENSKALDQFKSASLLANDAKSFALAPIGYGGRTTALIAVESSKPDRFADEQIELLRDIGTVITARLMETDERVKDQAIAQAIVGIARQSGTTAFRIPQAAVQAAAAMLLPTGPSQPRWCVLTIPEVPSFVHSSSADGFDFLDELEESLRAGTRLGSLLLAPRSATVVEYQRLRDQLGADDTEDDELLRRIVAGTPYIITVPVKLPRHTAHLIAGSDRAPQPEWPLQVDRYEESVAALIGFAVQTYAVGHWVRTASRLLAECPRGVSELAESTARAAQAFSEAGLVVVWARTTDTTERAIACVAPRAVHTRALEKLISSLAERAIRPLSSVSPIPENRARQLLADMGDAARHMGSGYAVPSQLGSVYYGVIELFFTGRMALSRPSEEAMGLEWLAGLFAVHVRSTIQQQDVTCRGP